MEVSILCCSLTACGGSGGDSSSAAVPTTPPVATTPVATAPTVIPADLVTSVPAFTGITDRIAAYTRINAVRGACGFGLLAQNARLETAAQNHSNYMGNNFASHNDVYSHVENAAYMNGFTGVNPLDRATLAGYGSTRVGEDIATANAASTTPQVDAVNALLQAGYHLRSVVGSGLYDMGMGTATLTPGILVSTLDFGSLSSTLQDIASNTVATYPCQGSVTTTSPQGIGHENPEPFPGRDYSAMPLGAPIYVRVRTGQSLVISSFTVSAAGGTAVTAAAILTAASDPNHLLQANDALFYPNAPLATATTYNVSIVGTNNGVAFTQTFSFRTS